MSQTNVTTVINQKDLMQETVRCTVHNAVHCPQKGVVVFIVKTNHHTGWWQIRRVLLLLTPADTWQVFIPM